MQSCPNKALARSIEKFFTSGARWRARALAGAGDRSDQNGGKLLHRKLFRLLRLSCKGRDDWGLFSLHSNHWILIVLGIMCWPLLVSEFAACCWLHGGCMVSIHRGAYGWGTLGHKNPYPRYYGSMYIVSIDGVRCFRQRYLKGETTF